MPHKEPVDLKLSKADRGGDAAVPSVSGPDEEQEYSYGCTIRLEKPELEKLGILSMPDVGTEYEICGSGKVTNVYESHSEGNKEDKAISIQITHLMVK